MTDRLRVWPPNFTTFKPGNEKNTEIKTICDDFLKFLREKYDQNYADSPVPEQFREGPVLLVGGYGKDDVFPSICRMNIQRNRVTCTFEKGHTGVSWNGQSDAVERFIRGYDRDARADIRSTLRGALTTQAEGLTTFFTKKINEILDKLGEKMPDGIDLQLPDAPSTAIDWNQYKFPLNYGNLPIQDAVNFVSFLVLIQAGKSRFAAGVPTVGGRTHIGVVTRDKGFRLLNEPELQHRYTGFSDDP
jgi:hypothetical protein